MQEEGTGETNRPIRVLLADDHTMFRQGLAKVLTAYGGSRSPGGTPTLRMLSPWPGRRSRMG